MFYSETLLSKTGPLARVWLAANIERKLTKNNILQSDIGSSVHTIIKNDQAPIALRLSGQLLLGVVRIYSRKARYLLDDCNEALMKIKLAFRPGNVDLPSNQSHIANPAALVLPDTITELDLFAPMPDLDELLLDSTPGPGQDPTLLDWGTSQLLPESMNTHADTSQTLQLEDDDIDLDIGDITESAAGRDTSIEIARHEQAPRPEMNDQSMLYPDDIDLEIGDAEDTIQKDVSMAPLPIDDDIEMGGLDLQIEESNLDALNRADVRRERDSVSPLSSVRSSVERDLEQTFQLEHQPTEIEQDETMIQAQQRAKRRKVLPADLNTELQNSQIRAQQEDRSKILKAPTFLPRDPVLLALMEMQKNGGFVSSILGDGRSMGWAPELRGVLSLEVVRTAGELKRKRDSGLPQIEIPEEEEDAHAFGAATSPAPEDLQDPTLGADDFAPAFGGEDIPSIIEPVKEDEIEAYSPAPAFDETTMPVLHPADSGPVSLGTKHAVHLLRERFSDEDGEMPSDTVRAQRSVLFTDFCPEERTSKQDATKMFFEVLVLGTKDAVKVEQSSDELGAPLRIRGKRGLWGDWAEMGAGGEIASQRPEVAVTI
jgi:cohesin complex subunit SCC1